MRHPSPTLARRTLLAALACLCLAAPAAAQPYEPNDTAAQAFGPLQLGVSYYAAFETQTDEDYYWFTTQQPNTSLHIAVANTTQNCNYSSQTPCPIWATLIDTAQRQLGGEGSSAGTGQVDMGKSDSIDWLFPAPGKYLLVFDSSGDVPTYSFRMTLAPPPRPIRVLQVPAPQYGNYVHAKLTLGQVARRIVVALENRATGAVVGRRSFGTTSAGYHLLTVPLGSAARAAVRKLGRLALRARVTVTPNVGSVVTQTRNFTVRRR